MTAIIKGKPTPKTSAKKIAKLATRGEDVSQHFTNQFKVVRPIQSGDISLTHRNLSDLDNWAAPKPVKQA